MAQKLTEDVKERICSVISFGGTREMAARVVGCHRTTIWLMARADKKFAAKLRQAEESPELTYLMSIADAAHKGKQWRAALWSLERMYPDRYAKRAPTAFTLEQMREVMNTVVETITRSVPGKANRETIRKKIEAYARSLAQKPRRQQLLGRKKNVKRSKAR